MPPFKAAQLKNRDGDLRKQWYVEYYPYSQKAEKPVRQMKELTGKYKWPFLTTILKHASIIQVATEFFELKKDAGIYFEFGIGPLRQLIELTPSKNTYKSLTKKSVKGDVINFLMWAKNMEFIEAVTWLGTYYSLLVDKEALIHEKDRRTQAGKKLEIEINILLEQGFHLKDLEKGKANRAQEKKSKPETPFKEAWNLALNSHLNTLSKGSVPNYKGICELFTDYLSEYGLANEPVKNIDSTDIEGFLDWCQNVYGIKNKTRNNRLSIISAMFGKLEKLGYRSKKSNPCADVKMSKTVKRKNFPFTKDDKKRLLKYMWKHDRQLYLASILIYYMYIRINETRALTVERFEFERKRVFIRPENKTYKHRYTEISEGLINELSKFDFRNWNPKHFLFSKDGKPGERMLHKDALTERFRDVLIRHNIDTKTHSLYCWKHTGVADAFEAGVSLYGLRDQCGHASIAQTAEYIENDLGLKPETNLKFQQPIINLED